MNLEIKRGKPTENSVIGELFLNGTFECYTLEGTHTMIPAGIYPVTLYNSPIHNYVVPLLQNVPHRDYIEMHIGCFPKDTKGCILVGQRKSLDCILGSRDAFKALMAKLTEPMTLTIS